MAYLAQNNAVRTRLGEGARMLAKKEFSLEMLGARLGALYRNTLNLKATS
ncbi:MAG: hypothetical protein BroJett038_33180 [Chloroflexota bacterium]|nr:MAG: hypothetical protein BroJett038_33180 [Chloroflexota bacterium]